MEDYLNKGIKDVIEEFPRVGKILDKYEIGCVPCNVGSCLLKDIVEIHNLSIDEEKKLMREIAGVIYPGKKVEIPEIKREQKAGGRQIEYSPPIKKLVQEHELIKRWVALIPDVLKDLNINSEKDRQLILEGVDFIKNYADKYHHAKEEDVLFKYFDEDLDIIKTMHLDHESARDHVKKILKAVEENNKKEVVEHLKAYHELLKEHIKKEDEILYPWMDRNLSDTQVGRLYSEFNEVDKEFGDAPDKYRKFIERIEENFSHSQQISGPRMKDDKIIR